MKPIVKKIITVTSVILFVFTILVMAFSLITFNTVGEENGTFLGLKPTVAQQDSTDGSIAKGDLVFNHVVDTSSLQKGDTITYKSIEPDPLHSQVFTNQIVGFGEYRGEKAFVMEKEADGLQEQPLAPVSRVIGEYSFSLPRMGDFYEFLRTTTGYLTVICAPFLLLILIQSVRFVYFIVAYRKEQKLALQQEQEKMKADMEKAKQLKEEIEKLRLG